MTTPKWLDLKISMGNILSILTIISGLTVGWFTMAQSVDINAKDVASLERRVTKAEEAIAKLSDNLQGDRLALNTVLTQLQSDVRYMRDAIDELKQRGQ